MPPSTVTVQLGQTIQLDCTAGGDPQPTVSWSRVDQLTQSGDQVTQSGDLGINGSLIIDHVTEQDEGQYFCIAENSLGNKIRSVTLQLPADSNWTVSIA